MPQPEAILQREIEVAVGALDGVVCSRNNVGMAVHHGGARVEYGVGGRGAPDLLCEVRTPIGTWAAVWLEVKTASGSLEKHQQQWHAAAQRMGRHVFVVRSGDDALSVVNGFRNGGCP